MHLNYNYEAKMFEMKTNNYYIMTISYAHIT